ncbi:Ig-like domain-containing protein, partial [Colwellia sp. MB02u-10]|uniref:Ig-like domain-containing protein n=1 Tax=Colwellia sp. MB02u-10 TaxID=2759828 RepID=UPI0028734C7C
MPTISDEKLSNDADTDVLLTELTWVSSNTAVATVAADGTVTVLANAPLATDTTITATLTVGYG